MLKICLFVQGVLQLFEEFKEVKRQVEEKIQTIGERKSYTTAKIIKLDAFYFKYKLLDQDLASLKLKELDDKEADTYKQEIVKLEEEFRSTDDNFVKVFFLYIKNSH